MTRTRWGIVATALAAGVVLTACGGGSDWPRGSVPAASPPPTPASSSAAPTSEAATSPAADGSGECRLDDLRAGVGSTTDAGSQKRTAVVWTNATDRPCTMTGFGGVDLAGPDDPKGPVFSLRRQEVAAEPVRLAPGGTAHTTITWLSQGGWTPTTIRATPPDETRSASLAWPGGPVLRQDGATRPGTYLSPVASGSG